MLYCAACGRHVTGQQNRYRHNFACPSWLAAAAAPRRAFRNAMDRRNRGMSYPADAFEGIVRQALTHVSANANLVADVVGALSREDSAPDPQRLARIERERDTALARYRRNRDGAALDATMRRLDAEAQDGQAAPEPGPTASQAIAYLRDLPRLWDSAEGSGRRLLAEALFDRIEVLGARKVRIHPSASARAQGWAEAWNGARLVVMVGARGLAPP